MLGNLKRNQIVILLERNRAHRIFNYPDYTYSFSSSLSIEPNKAAQYLPRLDTKPLQLKAFLENYSLLTRRAHITFVFLRLRKTAMVYLFYHSSVKSSTNCKLPRGFGHYWRNVVVVISILRISILRHCSFPY